MVGSNPGADLRMSGTPPGDERELFQVQKIQGGFQVLRGEGTGKLIYDGQDTGLAVIMDSSEHTLVADGHPFAVCCMGESGREWYKSIDPQDWYIHEWESNIWSGPFPPQELLIRTKDDPDKFIVLCRGMSKMGFFISQIRESLHRVAAEPQLDVSEIDTEYGEFTCPVCWFRFDRGDVMSVAVHADLRGDPMLGEEHMLRFLATRFNDRGQPLDALGIIAPEHACPHCRRKLPPAFLDEPHHIFSIVGAPSSGKSYYLSVLVKLLQSTLFRNFNATFRDASPTDNAVLNDMKNHLFSAATPEDAYLAKTELEGALYETLPRQGRKVRLPKPFVFRVSKKELPDESFSLVFYDNAGEHFEPGSNSADSPGAQHIAVASGIFFLFDPLYSPEFRGRIESGNDPQLEQRRSDQQDVILSETELRMKQILGLVASEKVATPLAVIIGKSDAWIDLMGDEQLLPAISSVRGRAQVLLSNIERNSDRIREFLLDVCPAIVANAEEISSDVAFFAASPLGSAPIRFIDSDGVERIGPDPSKLNPQRVEDATLWVLTKIAPSFFPSNEES